MKPESNVKFEYAAVDTAVPHGPYSPIKEVNDSLFLNAQADLGRRETIANLNNTINPIAGDIQRTSLPTLQVGRFYGSGLKSRENEYEFVRRFTVGALALRTSDILGKIAPFFHYDILPQNPTGQALKSPTQAIIDSLTEERRRARGYGQIWDTWRHGAGTSFDLGVPITRGDVPALGADSIVPPEKWATRSSNFDYFGNGGRLPRGHTDFVDEGPATGTLVDGKHYNPLIVSEIRGITRSSKLQRENLENIDLGNFKKINISKELEQDEQDSVKPVDEQTPQTDGGGVDGTDN